MVESIWLREARISPNGTKRGAVKDNDGHKGKSYIAGWYRICRKTKETNEKYSRSLDWGVISSHRSQCLRRSDFIKLCMRHRKSAKKFCADFWYIDLWTDSAGIGVGGKSVYGKLIGNREDIIKELGRIQAVDAVLDEQWNDLEVLFSETHRDELLALAKRICEDSNQQLGQVENDKENVGKTLEKYRHRSKRAPISTDCLKS